MRPEGPLAATFTQSATPPIPRRYDVLYVSPEIDDVDLQHRYEESVEAGSDHEIVVGSFDF